MVLNNKTYRTGLLILLFAAMFGSFAWAQEIAGPHKRVSKAIHKMWGEDLAIITDPNKSAYYSENGILSEKDKLFLISQNDELKAYVISSSARGRYDEFDYSVLFNENAVVLQVLVTVYRSTHGAAICQKNWLRQFEGYAGGKLELGKEIDAVSGGTLSASSLVGEIQRLQLQLSSLIIEKSP